MNNGLHPILTQKHVIKREVETSLQRIEGSGLDDFIDELHQRVLSARVRFPLLEYAGVLIYDSVDRSKHHSITDRIQSLRTIGGNVVTGKILQLQLGHDPGDSIAKAVGYISQADSWHICDIIGERVFGCYLLDYPQRMLPKISRMLVSENRWVIRALGAGAHYAIKKGLDQHSVYNVFDLLVSMAASKDKEIRQGIGWAAKTTAKFHPMIIEQNKFVLADDDMVAGWFRRKIKIGLERHQYAQGN